MDNNISSGDFRCCSLSRLRRSACNEILHLIRRQVIAVVVVVVVRVPVVVDIAHIVRVVRVVVARPKDTELNLNHYISDLGDAFSD